MSTILDTGKTRLIAKTTANFAKGGNMTTENELDAFLSDDEFHKSYSDLNELHTKLPQEAVVALAREVLERLANQINDPKIPTSTISVFVDALVSSEAKAAAEIVDERVRAGVTMKEVYLGILAPAAAMLGERWNRDEVTFADVTVGTGRIYAIMRSLKRRTPPEKRPTERSAVFAMVPGDDHVLGLKMAVDLARRSGWKVDAHFDYDHDTLVEAVKASGELLVGLSAGGSHSLTNLARLILALRVSVPEIKILVSGRITETDADKIGLLDTDATANTFEDAMTNLNELWMSFHADVTV